MGRLQLGAKAVQAGVEESGEEARPTACGCTVGVLVCSFLILLSSDIYLCLKQTKQNGQVEGESEVSGQGALCG